MGRGWRSGKQPGLLGSRDRRQLPHDELRNLRRKLYASYYDAIEVRTDGPNPSWKIIYTYPGSYTDSAASGFRGLTCVADPTGPGYHLIGSLEGPGDIYTISLDGTQASLELNLQNFLSTHLGSWAGYNIFGRLRRAQQGGTQHRLGLQGRSKE